MSTPPNPYKEFLPAPFVNPELLKHTDLFKKKIYHVGKSVYCYVGWNLANIIFVVTDTGLVVVDTGEDIKQMTDVWVDFHRADNKEIPDNVKKLPLIGIILTHHHADHVNGTQYLMQYLEDHNNIVGATNLDAEYQQENGLIMPLMSCRAMAQYNNLLFTLFPEECVGVNSGIGPIITQAITGYVKPTRFIPTVSNTINKITFGKSTFEFDIVYVPSEANSEIAMYLKAACFRQIGYRAICANWRGTYLTAAHELEGDDMFGKMVSGMRVIEVVNAETGTIVQAIDELAIRLIAENAENAPVFKIGLVATDVEAHKDGAGYLLTLRNCVLISKAVTPVLGVIHGADVTIKGSTATISVLLGGDDIGGFNSILHGHNARHTIQYHPNSQESTDRAVAFFSYFEVGKAHRPNIYVH